MPQRLRPARLAFDGTRDTWVIRDVGNLRRRLGLGRDQRPQAEAALAEYMRAKAAASTAEPPRHGRSDEVYVASVVAHYLTVRGPDLARPEEASQKADKLLAAWPTGSTLADVHGARCRSFAADLGSPTYARECLVLLRAAIRLYAEDGYLRDEVLVWLPDKATPREDWLTKSEIRALILTAGRTCDSQMRMVGPRGAQIAKLVTTSRRRWRHLIPYIVTAVWTCTRTDRIQRASYAAVPGRPWVDVDSDRPTYHRAARGEKVSKNKQAPPVPIGKGLARHMRSWRRDKTIGGKVRPGNRFVVEYAGRPVDAKKAFSQCVEAARLAYPTLFRHADGTPKEIVRHTLRHTGITWRAQAGQEPLRICQYAGLTMEVFQRVYSHHCPDHLRDMA